MRDVLAAMMPGWLQGGTAGLATVVRTFWTGSARILSHPARWELPP
jgi:hypothetical protein